MKPEERVLFGLKPDGASSPAAQDETGDKGKARSLALATYFFRVPRAYLPMLGHTIIVRAIPSPALHPKSNLSSQCRRGWLQAMLDYAISIWAPTRYLEELAVSPVQAGVYIAIPNIADFCSQFVTGAIEVSLTTFIH